MLKTLIDCETGAEYTVPMTDEEIAQSEADTLEASERQQAMEAAEAQKLADIETLSTTLPEPARSAFLRLAGVTP